MSKLSWPAPKGLEAEEYCERAADVPRLAELIFGLSDPANLEALLEMLRIVDAAREEGAGVEVRGSEVLLSMELSPSADPLVPARTESSITGSEGRDGISPERSSPSWILRHTLEGVSIKAAMDIGERARLGGEDGVVVEQDVVDVGATPIDALTKNARDRD